MFYQKAFSMLTESKRKAKRTLSMLLLAVCSFFVLSCSNLLSSTKDSKDDSDDGSARSLPASVVSGTPTIAEIQGTGPQSPYTGRTVNGVTGVVTMVCYKTAHVTYDTTLIDGSLGPQWISEDGFFMEALPGDKDTSGKASNGIFVSTHDTAYTDSKWKAGFPTDLAEGDVVTVNGTVIETRTEDRYNNSTAYLTRTGIDASALMHVYEGTAKKTAAYPDGVLLTYSDSNAAAWLSGHESDGYREARIMPFDSNTLDTAQSDAIAVLESVEDMVIRIDNPIVAGGTYYNITGVLADNGKKDGSLPRSYNSTWQGDVLLENDYNTEVLYVDYQSPTWKTFDKLAQPGDHLIDSHSAAVFRGVMDYTCDGLYMARPINPGSTLTSVTGESIYAQGWDFNNDATWYTSVKSAMEKVDTNTIKTWRTGSASAAADSIFTPSWSAKVTDSDTLTFASFNLENYEAQGGSYDRDKDLALIIKNNMLYPDVIVFVEMGDDSETAQVYKNQWNAWAIKDGVVTAVRNFSEIIDDIRTNGGPEYEFRQIDPVEGASGGAPGVNIRVGFLYNTARVAFMDRGQVTNHYTNTHDAANTLLDQSEWPLKTPGYNATALTETNASVYADSIGKPHLVQSPAYITDSSFKNSRNPLAGEFVFLPANQTFFVVACHLNSKGGDYPLYGDVQPAILSSEVQRNKQAAVIKSFLKKILNYDANAKIIVAGDMNDFQWATPLRVLTGELGGERIMYSVTKEFMPDSEQFSYAYRGNLQQIDHVFVSNALYSSIQAAGSADWKNVCFIPHIDSFFCRNNHLNFSDHDPVVVKFGGAF